MNFDPVSYLMHRETLRSDRERIEAHHRQAMADKIGDHERRIDSLESWRKSAMKTVRRWPYIAIPGLLVSANVAPKETVDLIDKLIKVAL